MAAVGSELDKMLAKRRSRGEKVFESNTATSQTPTPSGVGDSDASRGAEVGAAVPQWLRAAESQGIVFSSPGDAAPKDELPHWLEAAVECGVTFYDPDGNEVIVPSSKVGEFKAGLETVRDFEDRLDPNSESGEAIRQEVVVGSNIDAKPERTEVEKPAATSHSVDATVNEEAQKQNVKHAVQKRYFALLRDGVDPNEAAARAIREATGLGMSPGSASNDGVSASCASSAMGAGKDKRSTEVAVTA